MQNVLEGIINSRLKANLLVRFFLNPDSSSYLQELAKELGVSSNAVREELNQFSEAGLVTSEKNGRYVLYKANKEHSLYPELASIVSKFVGIDQVLESIINRLGNLKKAYILDDYAQGKDTGIIDLMLVGDIDPNQLHDLSRKTEAYLKRKIRTLVVDPNEYEQVMKQVEDRPKLMIWEEGKQ